MNKDKLEIWHFGDNKKTANKLFSLVKKGIKRATSYLYYNPLDNNEKYSILTNWDKSEKLLIETTSMEVFEFKDVTKEHAFKEGEGNKTLKYWKGVHKKFFAKELKKDGKEFNEHIKIVCEEFKIIEKID